MRELFLMDTKDYNEDGRVFYRPSARAMIVREGKVLLIYSKKYDYYKFPGGGIKEGESPQEALIREVAEESGYRIIPDSIKEYGHVLRRQRDIYDTKGIFEQDNLYYLCEAEDAIGETHLDTYEEEEGFTPVWKLPFDAYRHNRFRNNLGGDPVLIEREERVLELLDGELIKEKLKKRQEEIINSLGDDKYFEMFSYVEKTLGTHKTENIGGKTSISYSRIAHTLRVTMWAKRLFEETTNKEEIKYDDLITASIFHDVGRNYAEKGKLPHAQAGVPITVAYLLEHGYEKERAEYIGHLVGAHSDKYLLKEPTLDENLRILLEADLLDDMGALGIVMDCMVTEARNPQAGFDDCLEHIERYTLRLQQENPMASEAGRKFWEEKTKIVEDFVNALRMDVGL